MKRRLELLIIMTALLLLDTSVYASAAKDIPPPVSVKPDALVGAYYFPGWSQESRWHCIAARKDVLHPMLGYYREGDPEAADWHIKWALEHSISFFAFDFYTSGGGQMLETALDEGFLKARFIDRFRFCLNWCNHAPASEMTADEMERFGDLVIRKYLTHPSYLRIEDKPVVMILCGYGFIKNLGLDRAREIFGRFENRCKAARLPGVYLVFCEGEIGSPKDVEQAKEAGVRSFCLYNYPYAGTGLTGPGKHVEAAYADLIEQGEKLWKHWRNITGGSFWPTVMPGWDRRPWTKDQDLIRTGSTPELFAESLRRAKDYMNINRIVMIEAWNEWGEGSVLEPSTEHRFAYLDEVREVFCPNAGSHKDADPKSLGLRQPAFDLKLPCEDTWRFDYDTMGWTAKGLSNVQCHWGVLKAVSTDADPQLTGPITYLDCTNYSKVHLRMRAAGPDGGPESATGQLFWSTVYTGLSEAASVKFTVPLDWKWHDYDLSLREIPSWKGVTDRLRLDPVDVSNVRIEIDEVRVVK